MSEQTKCFNAPNCCGCIAAEETLERLGVPPHLHRGIRLYAIHRSPTGSFLAACFGNDFQGAVCGADEESLCALRAIAWWIWNEAPSECHGSPAKVAAWTRCPSEPEPT